MAKPLGGEIGWWCPTISGDTANAPDLVGSNDGMLVGGLTQIRDRARGGKWAWSLNGTTQSVETAGFVDHAGGVTLAAWVKLTAAGNYPTILYHSSTGTNPNRLMLSCFASNRTPAFYIGTTGLISPDAIPLDKWVHIAGVQQADGTNHKLYIDGVEKATNSVAIKSLVATRPVLIGTDPSGYRVQGNIDDARIWDRALAPAEVRELYKRGYQRQLDLLDPVAAWIPTLDNLGAQAGDTAADLAGGGALANAVFTANYVNDSDKQGRRAFNSIFTGGYLWEAPPQSALQNAERFTIAGWGKRTDGERTSIGQQATSNDLVVIEFWNDDQVYFSVRNGALSWGNVAIAGNDWHHLALVYDGTQATNATRLVVYADGVQQTLSFSSTIPAMTGAIDAPFRIGAADGGNGSGNWDDIRVFDRVLTQEEITKLASRRGYVEPEETPTYSYNKLLGHGSHNQDRALNVHYLGQDDPSGGMLLDRSAMKRNGTAVAMSQSVSGGNKPYLIDAINYDGNGYVAVPPEIVEARFTQGHSVFWAGGNNQLFSSNDLASPKQIKHSYESASRWYVGDSGRRNAVVSHPSNQYQHVDIAYADGDGKYFVDSAPDATATGLTFDSASTEFYLGTQPGLGGKLVGRGTHFAFFGRELSDSEIGEEFNGPEPICLDLPFFISPPYSGASAQVNPGTWIIDPEYAGDNGLVLDQTLDWYIADDDQGTGETHVATTTYPATYSPGGGDENKYLRFSVTSANDGGYDTAEIVFSDFALVQSGAGQDVELTGVKGETHTVGKTGVLQIGDNVVLTGVAGQTHTVGKVGVLQVGDDVSLTGVAGTTHTIGKIGVLQIGDNVNLTGVTGQTHTIGKIGVLQIGNNVTLAGVAGQTHTIGKIGNLQVGGDVTLTGVSGQTHTIGKIGVLQIGDNVTLVGVAGQTHTIGKVGNLTVGDDVTLIGTAGQTHTVGKIGQIDVGGVMIVGLCDATKIVQQVY